MPHTYIGPNSRRSEYTHTSRTLQPYRVRYETIYTYMISIYTYSEPIPRSYFRPLPPLFTSTNRLHLIQYAVITRFRYPIRQSTSRQRIFSALSANRKQGIRKRHSLSFPVGMSEKRTLRLHSEYLYSNYSLISCWYLYILNKHVDKSFPNCPV